MLGRSLSDDDIGRLLARPEQQSRANFNRLKWPGASNLEALAQAVSQKLPFVIFTHDIDRRFKIRYTKHFGGAVFVKPDSTALLPCGYFSLKELGDILDGMRGKNE